MVKKEKSTFWKYVPMKFIDENENKGEDLYKQNGIINCCIDPKFDENEAKHKGQVLPQGLKFREIDIDSDEDMNLVLKFINRYYNYSKKIPESAQIKFSDDYLRWRLDPPIESFNSEKIKDKNSTYWNIGVVSDDNPDILIGVILSTPYRYKLNKELLEAFSVELMCIHPKYRKKGLTAILMKEMSIRVQKLGMAKGSIFLTGDEIDNIKYISDPEFISIPLNIDKLIKNNNIPLQKEAGLRDFYKTKWNPSIRAMTKLKKNDIPELISLMHEHINNYHLGQVLTEDEFEHYFLSYPDIVESYVITNPITGQIQDFISYNIHTTKNGDRQAYLTYIIQTAIPVSVIIQNVLYIAEQRDIDSFFILDAFGIAMKVKGSSNFMETGIKKYYYVWNYNVDYMYPYKLGMILS